MPNHISKQLCKSMGHGHVQVLMQVFRGMRKTIYKWWKILHSTIEEFAIIKTIWAKNIVLKILWDTGSISIVIRQICSAQILDQFGPHKSFGALMLFELKWELFSFRFFEFFASMHLCLISNFHQRMTSSPNKIIQHHSFNAQQLVQKKNYLCYKKFCLQSDDENQWMESKFTKTVLWNSWVWKKVMNHPYSDSRDQYLKKIWVSRSIKNLFPWTY